MVKRKLLNRDVILHVEKIKTGLAGKLLDSFLGHAPSKFNVFRGGIKSGDWQAVGDAVHSLKSSAGHLGAEELLDVCQRLEKSAVSGDADMVATLAPEFESVYTRTLEALSLERLSWTPKEN